MLRAREVFFRFIEPKLGAILLVSDAEVCKIAEEHSGIV
jgi:hypothetical protein